MVERLKDFMYILFMSSRQKSRFSVLHIENWTETGCVSLQLQAVSLCHMPCKQGMWQIVWFFWIFWFTPVDLLSPVVEAVGQSTSGPPRVKKCKKLQKFGGGRAGVLISK